MFWGNKKALLLGALWSCVCNRFLFCYSGGVVCLHKQSLRFNVSTVRFFSHLISIQQKTIIKIVKKVAGNHKWAAIRTPTSKDIVQKINMCCDICHTIISISRIFISYHLSIKIKEFFDKLADYRYLQSNTKWDNTNTSFDRYSQDQSRRYSRNSRKV